MLTKAIKTQLTILQQEGYSISRFFTWWLGHPTSFTITSKKPLVLTSKARFLLLSSFIFFFTLFFTSLFLKLYFLSSLLLLFFILSPFLFLFLSILLITPYEKINRRITKNKTASILNSHNLKTIGITGSFGKTTVKDFLFKILNSFQQTVKTPESYNTVFGIAKVVKMEILHKTKFFICEIGAYIRGEVSEITKMVSPNYAILTAIGSQHLERFKTLENTTLAKFELIDSVSTQNALVNLDNPYIKKHLSLPQYKGVKTYSLLDPKADFFVNKYTLTSKGISFRIVYQKTSLEITSSVFGTSNLYNLLAAASMSLLLNVPPKIIKKAAASISPSPHRLELKKINKATLIDNAFSSNEEGFTAILNDLKNLKGKKVLLTPGIIELGEKTSQIHQRLGQISSSIFDKIILIGHSERIKNLEIGIDNSSTVSFIDNDTNLWPIIENLSKKYDWILLENDLPDTF